MAEQDEAIAELAGRRFRIKRQLLEDLQQQFGNESGTLGLIPQVLGDLLGDSRDEVDSGSERETDSPY